MTKERIADAFERRVERFGYRRTTVDEVASDLRISKKTVYVHFGGKADIHRFVVGRAALEARRELARAIAPLPTYGEKVEELVLTVVRRSRALVQRADDVATGAAEAPEPPAPEADTPIAAEAFREASTAMLAELVAGGIDADEFIVSDAALTARVLGAMLTEYSEAVREDAELDRDAEFAAAVRRYLG